MVFVKKKNEIATSNLISFNDIDEQAVNVIQRYQRAARRMLTKCQKPPQVKKYVSQILGK